MNIVNAQRADTGGQGIRLSRAIHETFPGIHTSRMFTKAVNYGGVPVDILYQKKWGSRGFPSKIMAIWKAADVYHLHHSIGWMRHWPLREMNPKAGIIMHSHGRPSTIRARSMREEKEDIQKRIRVVSTPGLFDRIFGFKNIKRWFPAPIDIVSLKKTRRNNIKNDGIIRIVHAPTVNKNTKEFLEVMVLIEQKYKHVKTIVISRQTQINAQSLKSVGDIHFNALNHGMGSNVFECMAMGIPSITGGLVHNYTDLIKEMHPNHVLPFLHVIKKEDLFEAIETLILDEPLRKKLAVAGMEWVEKYHSFEYTATLAIKTYQEAIALRS